MSLGKSLYKMTNTRLHINYNILSYKYANNHFDIQLNMFPYMLIGTYPNKHRHKHPYNLNCSYWSMRLHTLVHKSPNSCYMHLYTLLYNH